MELPEGIDELIGDCVEEMLAEFSIDELGTEGVDMIEGDTDATGDDEDNPGLEVETNGVEVIALLIEVVTEDGTELGMRADDVDIKEAVVELMIEQDTELETEVKDELKEPVTEPVIDEDIELRIEEDTELKFEAVDEVVEADIELFIEEDVAADRGLVMLDEVLDVLEDATGSSVKASALMISAAYDSFSTMLHSRNDQTYLFCYSVYDGLKMSGRNDGEYSGINTSNVLSTIHPQMGIDHATHFLRHHGQCSAGMVFCTDAVFNGSNERISIGIHGRHELCRLQLNHLRSCQDLSIEQQSFDPDLNINWI
jgi:hypothetical protein